MTAHLTAGANTFCSAKNIKWHGNSMFSTGKQRRLEQTSCLIISKSDVSWISVHAAKLSLAAVQSLALYKPYL